MSGVFFLALLAAADETPDEVYKRLAPGDRIEVTFLSGNTFTGKLLGFPRESELGDGGQDYLKAKTFTIDVSLEYPGLDGTMTIAKTQIRRVRKLQQLTPEQVKRLEEEKKRIEEAKKNPPKPPPKPAPPPAPAETAEKPGGTPKPEEAEKEKPLTPEEEAKKREEMAKYKEELLKKGKVAYEKFPPPDWGPDREKAIRLKLSRRQALNAVEVEFFQHFPAWDTYRRSLEEKKK
jgi:hypothetical protein